MRAAENLEHVDVALIDRAEREIAAYVLTDWAIMQALTRAADSGVKVRIYLDGTQLAEREPRFKELHQKFLIPVFSSRGSAPGNSAACLYRS